MPQEARRRPNNLDYAALGFVLVASLAGCGTAGKSPADSSKFAWCEDEDSVLSRKVSGSAWVSMQSGTKKGSFVSRIESDAKNELVLEAVDPIGGTLIALIWKDSDLKVEGVFANQVRRFFQKVSMNGEEQILAHLLKGYFRCPTLGPETTGLKYNGGTPPNWNWKKPGPPFKEITYFVESESTDVIPVRIEAETNAGTKFTLLPSKWDDRQKIWRSWTFSHAAGSIELRWRDRKDSK